MIHFRQILSGIDVQPLLDQVEQHPELWNIDNSWTRYKPQSVVIYNTDTIILRYNKSSEPGKYDWDKPAFSILSAAQSIIFDVMRAIPGEHLGKIVITRMRPGETIDWHIDKMPPGIPPYYQRYQIPLSVNPGVKFCVEDEILYMEPGNAYWFNNQKNHAVFNRSDADRISMLTDIRPFVPPNM